ncbi:citramalate synthase [Desulfosarcina ovata subsp. sediminis]|uniref:Citramalate synthase n=1 Tax=Desulfosarcina ovata subsp. sediminis TaxID=885957 RepID=A0A5K7ZDP2_9BACT|nr:citramalate synthase [Desulfosarcina ovata]BBO80122.1 citramalate synthase [Desulfosarcina ovata subsp. sediminis]
MQPILIYDTTLRDGTQGENITFTADEKLKIAKRLDEMGIQYIEGGWPGSNPRDMRFFELAKRETFANARITAFGSTRKPGIRAADDPNLNAILDSETPAAAIFGKTWPLHVTAVMENTLAENLAMIAGSVAFLKERGREVIYDAEHFFDGYKDDPDYALKTLTAAFNAGADFIVLCDTNGGTLPHELESIMQSVSQALKRQAGGSRPLKLGIHSHNDCGMAAANSISAVNCGAVMVHGTINGYGERCGNADLTTIIPILCAKMNRPCIPAEKLSGLKSISRYVSETANIVPINSRPFVGRSAFAHKGGIHVSAIIKEPRAYEHMDPEQVGNQRRVLMSDLAGKSNVEYKAKEMGVDLCANGCDSKAIVAAIKQMEEEGYQFDVADGSFQIMLEKFTEQFKPLFDLESFRVTIEKDKDFPCSAHATIKISVGDSHEITAAEGLGPVSALDNALRKALGNFYPDLDTMKLVDFKVRVVDGRDGTEAKVRVFIESRDQDQIWSTIGVSEDIIDASWQALADSFQFKLAKEAARKNQESPGVHAGNEQPPAPVSCNL